MPIVPIEPPASLAGAVRSTLDQLLPRVPGVPTAGAGAESAAGSVTVGRSTPLFHLGLDDIVTGRGLAAAHPLGWRTDVEEAGVTVAVADTSMTAAGAAPEVRQVARGPLVSGLAAATAGVEEAASDGEYEQRSLQVPGVSLTAVWLHPVTDGTDLLLPADPAPPGVTPGRAYDAGELLAIIAPLARERLDADPTRAR